MLQRIQTLYMFLAALVSAALPNFFFLWELEEKQYMAIDNTLYFSLFMGSALLSIVSIFLYNKRQNQFVLNRLNMILNFILIGLFLYVLLNLSGEAKVSEKGIGVLIPLFSIFLLVFANKAIKKDEDLVKSVDRIR